MKKVIYFLMLFILSASAMAVIKINSININPPESVQGGAIDIWVSPIGESNPQCFGEIIQPDGNSVLFDYEEISEFVHYFQYEQTTQIGNHTLITTCEKGGDITQRNDTIKIVPISDLIDYVEKVGEVGKLTNQTELFVAGTEYEPFDATKVFVQLSEGGQPVNNATCYIDIYYPNGTIWINGQSMVNEVDSNGLYYYQAYAPNITGVYMVDVECQYFLEDVWFYDLLGDSNSPTREIILGDFYGSTYNLNDNDALYEEGVAVSSGGSYMVESVYNFTDVDNSSVENMILYWMGESDSDPIVTFYWWNWSNSSWVTLPNVISLSASIPSQAYAPSGIADFVTNPIPDEAYDNSTNMVRIKLSASNNKQYDLWNDWLNINHHHLLGQTIYNIRGGGEIHITEHKTIIKNVVFWIQDYLQNTIFPFLQNIWNQLFVIESGINQTQEYVLEVNDTTHLIKDDTSEILSDLDAINKSMLDGFAEKDAHIQSAYDNLTQQMAEFRQNNTDEFAYTNWLINQIQSQTNNSNQDIINYLSQIDSHINKTYQDILAINQSTTDNINKINESISGQIQDSEQNIIEEIQSINNTLYNEIIYTQTLMGLINQSLSNQIISMENTIQSNFTDVFSTLDTIQSDVQNNEDLLLNLSTQLSMTSSYLEAHMDSINASINNRFDILESDTETIIDLIDNLTLQFNSSNIDILNYLYSMNTNISQDFADIDLEFDYTNELIENVSNSINFTEILNDINDLSVQVDYGFNLTNQNIDDLDIQISLINQSISTEISSVNQNINNLESSFNNYTIWINDTMIEINNKIDILNVTTTEILEDTDWLVDWHSEFGELILDVTAPSLCLYGSNWLVYAHVTNKLGFTQSPNDGVVCQMTTELWATTNMTFDYGLGKYKYIHPCDVNSTIFDWSVNCFET